jgi:hypothetical protein
MKPSPNIAIDTDHELFPDAASFEFNEGTGQSTYCYINPAVVGTLNNGARWEADAWGRYIRLNDDWTATGAGFISIPTSSSVSPTRTNPNLTEDWSIECVFDYVVTDPTGKTGYILDKPGDYRLWFDNGTLKFDWYRNGNNVRRQLRFYAQVSGGVLRQHIAGETWMKESFDGQAAGAQSSANPLTIGAKSDGTLGYYGNIRFLRFRRHTLTLVQQRQLQMDPCVFYGRTPQGPFVPFVVGGRFTRGGNTYISAGGGSGNVALTRISLFEGANVKRVDTGVAGTDPAAASKVTTGALNNSINKIQTTWNGNSSTTVAAGAVVLSDAHDLIVPAHTCVQSREFIQAAGSIAGNGYVTGNYWGGNFNSTVGYFPTQSFFSNSGEPSKTVIDGSTLTASDLTLSDTVIAATNIDVPHSWTLLAQRTTALNHPVVWLFGTSIMFGQGSSQGVTIGGYAGYACTRLGLPTLNLGIPGDSIQGFAVKFANYIGLMSQLDDGLLFICCWEYGINDINNGRTASQIRADYATAIAAVNAAHPNTRHLLFTFTPDASSTDNFVTVANQTANAATLSHRLPFLNWMRKNHRTIGIHRVVEVAAAAESEPDSNKWKVNGSTAAWATDHIHPYEPAVLPMSYVAEQAFREEIRLVCLPEVTATTDTTVTLAANHFGGEVWIISAWTCTSKPTGSTVTFDDAASDTPVATIDRSGEYVFSVTVTDAKNATATGTVTVRIPPPVSYVADSFDRGDGEEGTLSAPGFVAIEDVDHTMSRVPTKDDDYRAGYRSGQTWGNTVTGVVYRCWCDSIGGAIWGIIP